MHPGELAVVSLGFVTPAKCIEQTIRALASIRSEVPPFRFWIFGEMRHPSSVRRTIREHGMTDVVVEKGYTSLQTFEAAIEASDLVVNLRYPTVGETSGTMTRAMGAGKPVVVFRHGSFMEPPLGSVAGIPLDTFDTSRLSEVCRGLLCDESRRKIGCQARSWASSVTPAMRSEYNRVFIRVPYPKQDCSMNVLNCLKQPRNLMTALELWAVEQHPVFIVGIPRSGTTRLSNIISRFIRDRGDVVEQI